MCLCVARACRHHLSRVHPYRVGVQSEPGCSSPFYLPTCRECEKAVSGSPSGRRRLEANCRNMRQRAAVCHIPQAQQQPISLKQGSGIARESQKSACHGSSVRRYRGQRQGGRESRGRDAARVGSGTTTRVEPGRVVAASPLARQRHACGPGQRRAAHSTSRGRQAAPN